VFFTVSSVLVSLLGIVSTALLARNLATSEYGSYSFTLSLLVLSALAFGFGFFSPAARLAAIADPPKRREIVGAALLLYLPVGAAFSLFIFFLSYGVDDWFNVEAGAALRIAAPVAFAIPFTALGQQLAQGTNRLHITSAGELFMQALFVCLLGLIIYAHDSLNLTIAIVVRCSSVLAASALVVIWLRPSFRRFKARLRELLAHTREYGVQIYVGRLLSIGTYSMDVLMLGAFATAASVGFYTLAGSIAAAANLPALALASALFATMAREVAIRARWLHAAIGIGVVTVLAAWALAGPFIDVAFSQRYAAAARLVLPLAAAQAVRGVTGIYNSFLAAHGRGRDLRNAGLVLTASNLVLNFALIPPYGAMGAAVASLLALLVNLAAHVYFYRRSRAIYRTVPGEGRVGAA
jgi:O-antigen/teichoic acid export membrane protein